ncbi:DNA mismatch repair endonuclease MutL [Capnocytophaga canimorsus]|nr:DNA mismatch repair endonuclease MutL [Capnocytophaga canimorsus]WGU67596.1 DNA mismatch repair endonuclease MutL [Capnocytophaga canimorsus]
MYELDSRIRKYRDTPNNNHFTEQWKEVRAESRNRGNREINRTLIIVLIVLLLLVLYIFDFDLSFFYHFQMTDVIRLLPDHVANQIAAGEVIQRPASAVKELLENAIDAQSTEIKLIIKDAGKTLVQVIDNGIGMSVTDARLAFERHATSKIQSAEDLFTLRTKGFRGEALASIAAIAHVEMITKRAADELATEIRVEGSKFTYQEPCVAGNGTSVAMKNLFFNIPARRNFLKSDSVELRHIIDEFHRVALAHPNIHFYMYNNGSELFNLPVSNFRQRVVNLFGVKTNEKLVPIEEETPVVKISGFVVKPEHVKKNETFTIFTS